ncbi:MAG: hypothetical protein JSV17_08920 [Candidatus Aminicenantes bacterium]|nr:MAG: hypothetical protein JSV17_08920 [Candidatus Aminicenantes bacterium]
MNIKMHKGNRFQLRFHEGYKGKETPRAVFISSREFKIDCVLERKRIFDKQTGKRSDVFTCEMEGQRVRIVVQDSGEFELVYL